MKSINIYQLQFLEQALVLDMNLLQQSTSVADRRRFTYLTSYPYFVNFFAAKDVLTLDDLIIGGSLVYSWMPTVLVWKNNNFSAVVELLNKAKNSDSPIAESELLTISSLINGSIVGASKLLHFIKPSVYPIWDSKINEILHRGNSVDTNSIRKYQDYLDLYTTIRLVYG